MNRYTLVAFAILVSFFFSAIVHAQSNGLTFVASHTELYAALDAAEKGTIGSVAIAEKYYQEGTSRIQKNQLRGLIARTFELGDRAVYIYGQPLNVGLADELLDMKTDGCNPPYFSGKLMKTKDPTDPVELCGASDKTLSEETMRKNLVKNEKEARSFIRQ